MNAQFYILHGAGGQHYVISYATHTPITEPGFASLHAAVEWLERNRPGSGDYDMVELADPQEVPLCRIVSLTRPDGRNAARRRRQET